MLCEREMDTTAAARCEIFAAALQDHYISKSIAADASTGSTPPRGVWGLCPLRFFVARSS